MPRRSVIPLLLGLAAGCYASHGRGGSGPDAGPRDGGPPVPMDHRRVGTGGAFSCSVTIDGRGFCWGFNGTGQLGDGLEGIDASRGTPAPVVDLPPAHEIDGASAFACAHLRDGGVMCWGSNTSSTLGDGTSLDHVTPAPVIALPPVDEIEVGWFHVCARAGGSVYCWGSMPGSTLGDGATSESATPLRVPSISDAADLGAGETHQCVVRASGAVACWGAGETGALGDGTSVSRGTPVAVVGLTDAVDVDCGAGFSCAVRATGEVACWGTNTNGQLGNGETRTVEPAPVATLGIDDAVAVSLGTNNACALRASGRVSCWGFDGSGRIGDGPGLREVPVPVDVVGLEDAVQIAASDNGHVCAVRRTDDIVCWGNGARGALGTGEDGGQSDVPVAVLPHG